MLKFSWVFLLKKWKEWLISSFALSLIIFSVLCFVEIKHRENLEMESMIPFDGGLIAPKGSSLKFLRGFLGLNIAPDALIPNRLLDTLEKQPNIQFEDKGKYDNGSSGQFFAPLLWLGQSKEDVVWLATRSSISQVLGFVPVNVGPGEATLGTLAAERLGKKVGDVVDCEVQIATQLAPIKMHYQVKQILPPAHNSWDRVALVSLVEVQNALRNATFDGQNNIWSTDVVSFVAVKGGSYDKISQLIQLRTVATFLKVSDELQAVREFAGKSPLRDRIYLILIVGLGTLAFAGYLGYLLKSEAELKFVLKRLGHSINDLWLLTFFHVGSLSFFGCALGFALLHVFAAYI